MTAAVLLAGCAAGLATVFAGDTHAVARRRLRQVGGCSPRNATAPGRSARETAELGTLLIGAAAVLAVLLVLGLTPVLLGTAPAALLVARRRLRARAAARRTASRCAAQLPRAADLVAACLEAGATPADALDIVREHMGEPLASRLTPAVGALRAGADPLDAYASAAALRNGTARPDRPARHGLARVPDDPARLLVRALARAMDSGAPVATTVAAVADEQRRRQRWAAEAAARRAGVLAVGPLVVCFLPAFVLLGVVPVVLGIAADVLGGLT